MESDGDDTVSLMKILELAKVLEVLQKEDPEGIQLCHSALHAVLF